MLHSLITMLLIGLPGAPPVEPDDPVRSEPVVTFRSMDPPVVVVSDGEEQPELRAESRALRRDRHEKHGSRGCDSVRVTSVGPDGRVVTRLIASRKR